MVSLKVTGERFFAYVISLLVVSFLASPALAQSLAAPAERSLERIEEPVSQTQPIIKTATYCPEDLPVVSEKEPLMVTLPPRPELPEPGATIGIAEEDTFFITCVSDYPELRTGEADTKEVIDPIRTLPPLPPKPYIASTSVNSGADYDTVVTLTLGGDRSRTEELLERIEEPVSQTGQIIKTTVYYPEDPAVVSEEKPLLAPPPSRPELGATIGIAEDDGPCITRASDYPELRTGDVGTDGVIDPIYTLPPVTTTVSITSTNINPAANYDPEVFYALGDGNNEAEEPLELIEEPIDQRPFFQFGSSYSNFGPYTTSAWANLFASNGQFASNSQPWNAPGYTSYDPTLVYALGSGTNGVEEPIDQNQFLRYGSSYSNCGLSGGYSYGNSSSFGWFGNSFTRFRPAVWPADSWYSNPVGSFNQFGWFVP